MCMYNACINIMYWLVVFTVKETEAVHLFKVWEWLFTWTSTQKTSFRGAQLRRHHTAKEVSLSILYLQCTVIPHVPRVEKTL